MICTQNQIECQSLKNLFMEVVSVFFNKPILFINLTLYNGLIYIYIRLEIVIKNSFNMDYE